MEYEEKDDVNLIHYTIGTPCFKEYSKKIFHLIGKNFLIY